MPTDRGQLRYEARLTCLPAALAELRARGITAAQVRGRGWRRTSYGYYAPAEVGIVDGVPRPLQRILDALPLVPEQGALTGWAAAYLAGVTELDGTDPASGRELPVAVCLGGLAGRATCRSVRYLRDRVDPAEIERTTLRVPDALGRLTPMELPATAAGRAAYDGVRLTSELPEAVAFVDACAHARWLDLLAWRDHLRSHRGSPGIRWVRRTHTMADAASRSRWESRLRVFYEIVAGLPQPQVNLPIFTVGGQLLGIGDLVDVTAGLVTEFDGAQHRERRQHRADNEREERFEDAGLTVVRVDSLDLTRYQARLASRLQSGHRRGTERDRRRDSWTVDPPRWWLERYR